MWSLLRVLSILFLTEFSLSCVPTKSVVHTTVPDVPVPAAVPTTIPCCPILSQTALPKRPPVSADFEQCSILRRVSSSCPTDGYVFCDAAPDTNPTTMQIEFFNGNGTVVRTVQKAGVSLNVRVCSLCLKRVDQSIDF
ncbi:unnamed protein product [Nippostrongylus brasiliensis]|uniref:Secreted protein n=1 Tax=Nippostrongylus brasiliensis TaxID=27835 RepID=A0A0N4YE84_NIPBR|nr:unnamed protein product [Nippostrongylus brasiliensis]